MAAGITNGMFIGIGHNFMHQRTNFRRHYLNLSGFCSAEFRMHHALSHHPYTNTVLDAEMNSLLPHLNFFPHQKTLGDKAAAGAVLMLVCFLGIPLKQLMRFWRILTRSWPAEKVDYIAQLIPVLQLVLFCNCSMQQLSSGITLWMLMLTTCSAVFLWGKFLEGPHFNDECWHQGDTLDSTDWGILQVQTSVERTDLSGADSFWPNLMNVVTFNHHHLHHLFPTIDAVYLSKLQPLFDDHCQKYGVVFDKMSNLALARGLWRCIISENGEPNDRTRNGVYMTCSGSSITEHIKSAVSFNSDRTNASKQRKNKS